MEVWLMREIETNSCIFIAYGRFSVTDMDIIE
jgi:hypothetical protein